MSSKWPKQHPYPKERLALQLPTHLPLAKFRSLSLNESGDLVFAYPLTEREASGEPHYRVESSAAFHPDRIVYASATGQPLSDETGVAIRMIEWDDGGHRVGMVYFDARNCPTADRDGVHAVRWESDDAGRLLRQAYYDLESAPTACAEAYHAFLRTYRSDKSDRSPETLTYFDPQDLPTANHDGIAAIEWTYDDAEHTVEKRFLGLGGELHENAHGVARTVREFTERGELVLQRTYDARGRDLSPTLSADGEGDTISG